MVKEEEWKGEGKGKKGSTDNKRKEGESQWQGGERSEGGKG